MEAGTELPVAIDKDMRHAVQEAVKGIGQIPGDLLHPRLVWIRRASGEVNASSGEFHHEEQVARDQSATSPNLDR